MTIIKSEYPIVIKTIWSWNVVSLFEMASIYTFVIVGSIQCFHIIVLEDAARIQCCWLDDDNTCCSEIVSRYFDKRTFFPQDIFIVCNNAECPNYKKASSYRKKTTLYCNIYNYCWSRSKSLLAYFLQKEFRFLAIFNIL